MFFTSVQSRSRLNLSLNLDRGRSAQVPYDPVLVWTEQNQCERNGQTWRSQYHGVYVLPTSRTFRDVIGATFKVQFEIVDVRPATGA